MSTALTKPVDATALERVIAEGDLSRLTPEQRTTYYLARCDAAGVDPRTQPFQYLTLKGKLVLYATKTASDQLIAAHSLDVRLGPRDFDRESGVAEQRCRVLRPDGSAVDDVGALYIGNAKGEDLANALMKLVTKAKRRTVLSACGLGMLDESEIDSIPGARREPMPPMPNLRPETEDDAMPAWIEPAAPPPRDPFEAAADALRKAGTEADALKFLKVAKGRENLAPHIDRLEAIAAERIAEINAGRTQTGSQP